MNEFADILQTVLGKRAVQFWLVGLLFSLAIISGVAWPTALQAETGFTLDLASLEVTDPMGTTIDLGTFDPAVRNYSANVASTVERVTVTARPESSAGVYVHLTPTHYGPGDNQWEVEGQEVRLNHGRNLIVIGVYSYRVDEPLRVYTVEIHRPGSATSGAATYISSSSLPTGREGSTLPFLFTRSSDASAALTVDVDLWRYDGDLIKVIPEIDPVTIQERVQVVFPAGYSSVILYRDTTNDSIHEGNYYLGVTVVEGSEYQISTNGGYASTTVWDDDYNRPTLASLSLKDKNDAAVSFGAFDPGRTSYTGSVASETDFITVEPARASASDAQVDILPSDSKPGITGHQVDLLHGDNLISIVVRTPLPDPASPSGTYQVEINRAGSSTGTAPSTVSIYGLSTGREGETMPFLLTRKGDTSQSLTVPVNVTEPGGDMVSETSRGRSDVEFRAGDAWAKIEVPTNADQDWEEHSTITASVVDGTGYDLSSGSGSASSKVVDNDVPNVTASFSVDSSRVEEGKRATVSITLKTDGAKQPHNYVGNLKFIVELGTAQEEDVRTVDFRRFPESSIKYRELSWGVPQDIMLPVIVNGIVEEYRHQITVPIIIVDDERAEDAETFDIKVEWDSYHQSKNPLTMDQGITSRTITIPGHDETPSTPDPASYITVEIEDSGSAGSTYTVSWHDTGECASNREYSVNLVNDNPDDYGWIGYLTLGTTASRNTQLTASTENFPLSDQRVVRVYCAGVGGWLVGEVPLPSATEDSVERPVPGTYSSQPALTSLTVSPGTLGPAFNNYGFLYSVLDVPHSNSQITLNATARSGYTISWDPSEDADSNTAGHQVNLAEGYNSIFISVDHDQGINSFTYEIIVKGAALISQQAQENTAATGAPNINGTVQVGQTLTASTTGISDADGLTTTAYSYQWIANAGTSDSDIADATASSYALVDGDVGKTIKAKVSFTDDGGNEETLTSAATSAVAATMPDAPSIHSVSVSDTGKLDVSWAAPESSGGSAVTGYRVQWKKAADSWDTPADVSEATVTGTSHTVSGLTDGVEYTFRVFAVNTVGDSPASEEESGTPRETTAPTVSSATVVDATLTIAFSKGLTETPLPTVTAFTVNVAGSQREVDSLAISGSTVTLTMASAVTSTDAVTVSYTAPSDASATRLNDLSGNSVASFTGQAVTNSTAAVQTPLRASIHDEPTTHDGQTEFTFELRFSENLEGFSYKTLRDHAFTVTGGAVAKARRLTQGSNIGWEITVTPDSDADVTVVLPVTMDCNATGAVCTADGRKLSNRLELTVSGPTSQQSSQQSQENTAATGAPTISGTIQVGETLTADTSDIDDSDGLTNATFEYQWLAGGSDIDGANGSSYLLTGSEQGETIQLRVTFTDDADNEESLTSEATTAVAARPNTPATGAPSISGTVQVGETLAADTSDIDDADGISNDSFSYQWAAGGSDISGATGSSYTLMSGEEGQAIQVRVSFTDDAGNVESVTSAATAEVAARPNSPAAGVPAISGTSRVGETLTASTSSIADSDGLDDAVFTYQWVRSGGDDGDIPGATDSTHVLDADDEGKTIRVRVSYTDDAGHRETLTSAATGAVTVLFWSAALTVGSSGTQSGYSAPQDTGALSPDEFSVGVAGYRVQLLLEDGDGTLRFGLDRDIPTPFTIHVGTVRFASGEANALASEDGTAYTYRWDGGEVDWSDGEEVELSLTMPGTPLTAVFEAAPGTHDGQTPFTFELRFSEEFTLSYKTLRDDAFTVTAGSVTNARRLEPPGNVRWEITVTPDAERAVTIVLPVTTDCDASGAICTQDGGKLSQGLELTVAVTNTPATGTPTISGALRVGETLTADLSAVADVNGLANAAFTYQWTAGGTDIGGATGSSHVLTEEQQDLTIQVSVGFTDDEGNAEAVTSAATDAVGPASANSPATGNPAISGTATNGETLTADTSGIADENGLVNAVFSYQWIAGSTDIANATDASHTLTTSEEGLRIRVRVSFTDDGGNAEAMTSAATGAVASRPNSPATGAPAISGTTQVGETLTADTSGIADEDGLVNAAFSYRWTAAGADIAGATGSTYALTGDEEGLTIQVSVSYTDDAGNEETLTSEATAAVAAKPNSPATGQPTITGTAQVGETLTADTSAVADRDGLDNVSFGYQWLADDSDIESATDSTYELSDADVGRTIRVTVSFADDRGHEETLTSEPTAKAAAKPNSPATGQPAISGTAQVGETLTADTSSIADADGLDNASFGYQWLADDSDIPGATDSAYTLADADVGKTIRVTVAFTDDAGNEETMTSEPTAEAAGLPPEPLTARFENQPSSHDGENVFTFELRFSEQFHLSYKTLRDHAFTVTGGTVKKAKRMEQGSNIHWRITVRPDSNSEVSIVLPVTTDCDGQGAICTEDGRELSNRNELTVSGPGG